MYLLDTNVVSELRKVRAGKADPRVSKWVAETDASEHYVSVITIQELEIGILLLERRDGQQGAMLRSWLESQVLPAFEGRVLAIDLAVVRRAARLHVPDPKSEHDALIAATALIHGMTIVTRNAADFEPCGVKLLNPWDPGCTVEPPVG